MFIVASFFLGLIIIKKIKLKTTLPVKAIVAGIIGITGLTQIIFWQSFILPFNKVFILATIGLVLIISLVQIKFKKIKYKRPKVNQVIFAVFWLSLWSWLWSRMLVLEPNGLFAGWVNIWGDWAAHLSYTTSFGFGDNFPPQMPLLAGARFSYPFMADFLSAILLKLDLNLIEAMILPSLWLSMLLTGMLYIFGGRISTWLFLLNGGLGFLWLKWGEELTHAETLNIEWINIITSQAIPQRGWLMGFPIALLVYWLLWRYWQNPKNNNLGLAGLLTTSLALIHAHSLILVSLVAGLLMLQERKIKPWIKFFLPVVVLGLPQVFYFYGSSLSGGSFIRWRPGWLADRNQDFWLWFWFKNLGAVLPLSLIGFKLAGKKLRQFSLGFWIIFILANLWQWQPWEWDNTKLITHWYLIAAVLAGKAIEKGLNSKEKIIKSLSLVFFSLSILSGSHDVWRLTQYQQRKIRFFTTEQLTLADKIRKNTNPKAIFLTADNHDHWVPVLTGRKIVLGFKGWLWSYGLDFSRQEQAVKTIYQGGEAAKELLKHYQVDYIVIGPMEKESNLKVNTAWLEANFPVWLETETTKILATNITKAGFDK